MTQSDKSTLIGTTQKLFKNIEMGFSELKVQKALQMTKNAGLQPAMDW
jgi:uncharacterized UBP type Zn finger protein